MQEISFEGLRIKGAAAAAATESAKGVWHAQTECCLGWIFLFLENVSFSGLFLRGEMDVCASGMECGSGGAFYISHRTWHCI